VTGLDVRRVRCVEACMGGSRAAGGRGAARARLGRKAAPKRPAALLIPAERYAWQMCLEYYSVPRRIGARQKEGLDKRKGSWSCSQYVPAEEARSKAATRTDRMAGCLERSKS
jgi:hypothetical protein